jgi:hypothetical protein
MTMRKAAYKVAARATPDAYVIDRALIAMTVENVRRSAQLAINSGSIPVY